MLSKASFDVENYFCAIFPDWRRLLVPNLIQFASRNVKVTSKLYDLECSAFFWQLGAVFDVIILYRPSTFETCKHIFDFQAPLKEKWGPPFRLDKRVALSSWNISQTPNGNASKT